VTSPYTDLARPPLHATALKRALVVPGGLYTELRVVAETASTNADVAAAARAGAAEGLVITAESQVAGRGRQGRGWSMPPRSGIAVSVLLRPDALPPAKYGWLPLLAGVAVVEAVRRVADVDAALKWPNDLLVEGAKLGGILVEAHTPGGNRDGSYAVIGLGINCRRTPGLAARLRRDVAFVSDFTAVSRNEILQRTAAALLAAIDAFEAGGLDALRAEWEAMDAHAGQRLRVRLAGGRIVTGVSGGLAEDGALRLVTRNGVRAVRSGRVVSARAQ